MTDAFSHVRSLAAALLLAALLPAALAAQAVAITGARIHPVAGPVIERGTVVIRDGKIAAVGADVAVPAGARVIDGTGKVITPGFLDSFTQLGLLEVGPSSGVNIIDVESEDDRLTAAFTVEYGLNPASTLIPLARTGGITRAVVAPSMGATMIAGQGLLMHLLGERVQDLVIRDPVAMFGNLDAEAAWQAGGTRTIAFLRIREALEDAGDFARNRRAWETASRRSYVLSRLDLEALAPVARGELPFAIHVDRAADILATLRLADEYGLKLILLGAKEGWMVADEIARSGATVVLNPMENIPSFDALGATLENASRLNRAGAKVVFATFDAHNVRNLRQAAGNAVAHGMPHEAALRAVTVAPAQLWGIADRYGTLEPGKDADIVVWSGDPFEPLTSVEHVFINGREAPPATRQTELLERYRRLGEPLPPAYRATGASPPGIRR